MSTKRESTEAIDAPRATQKAVEVFERPPAETLQELYGKLMRHIGVVLAVERTVEDYDGPKVMSVVGKLQSVSFNGVKSQIDYVLEGVESVNSDYRISMESNVDMLTPAGWESIHESSKVALDEKPQLLTTANEDDELGLRILLSQTTSGYAAEVTEYYSGSNSDDVSSTLGEAVEWALAWAGVEGFKIPSSISLEHLRRQLQASCAASAGDLTIEIYSDF